MRVVGVIEQDNNRYIVNTSFTEHELEVIVNCGLRWMLSRGAMPLSKDEEGNLHLRSPSEVKSEEKSENPPA